MAYFFLSLVYIFLVPFMLSYIVPMILSQPFWYEIIPSFSVIEFIILFACFAAMLLYGYMITKTKDIEKPKSMVGIYLPVVLPLMWFLLCAGTLNVLNLSYETYSKTVLAFLTFNLIGLFGSEFQILGFDWWHAFLLISIVYYCVLIVGFAVGERFAAHRIGVKRKSFGHHRKLITITILIFLLTYSLSEFILFEHRRNILTTPRPSYNFSFEKGYSSIDLKPYYVENEENILANLDEPSTFCISDPAEMPVLDGAEAAYPVYSAFANACYENIGAIQQNAKNSASKDTIIPIQFTNTIYAYEKLLTGEIDIFFGAKPSEEQFQMAENAGVELILTPIGKEAFVFFVNDENPVDNLSSEQLRDIYSGNINNWRKVGGKNQKILAFQRPENSGSQTMMKFFMGDTPLRKPLEREYISEMGDVVRYVANYEINSASIGYSFRYYTTIMMAVADSMEDVTGIKLLAVDGIYPDSETIQSEEYPFTTELYAITVKSNDSKSTIEPFLAWMTGPQGQQIVEKTGYIALP